MRDQSFNKLVTLLETIEPTLNPNPPRVDEGDHEVRMAHSQIESIMRNAKTIHDILKSLPEGADLEAWAQSKLTMADDYLVSVADFMRTEYDYDNQEVIEEVAGKYWDEDVELNNLPFNIIVGEEAILNKQWMTGTIDHMYYRKEDQFLKLDGSYKTLDGSGKGRFAVFVEKDGTLGAETNGDVKGHWSGRLNDMIPFNPKLEKPKHTLYLSTGATKMVNRAKFGISS